jgi:hypothetical protein
MQVANGLLNEQRYRRYPFRRALRLTSTNYWNLAMWNVMDGTILTFGIRSPEQRRDSVPVAPVNAGSTNSKMG